MTVLLCGGGVLSFLAFCLPCSHPYVFVFGLSSERFGEVADLADAIQADMENGRKPTLSFEITNDDTVWKCVVFV